MSDIISIQYDQMQTIASNFTTHSQNVKTVCDDLKQCMQLLSNGGWISDSADAFYGSMNDDVLLGFNRLIDALSHAGETAKNISTKLQTAENDARSYIPTSS